MAVAGAGAGAEILDKFGAGAENKQFRLRNTAKKNSWNKFVKNKNLCAFSLLFKTLHVQLNVTKKPS